MPAIDTNRLEVGNSYTVIRLQSQSRPRQIYRNMQLTEIRPDSSYLPRYIFEGYLETTEHTDQFQYFNEGDPDIPAAGGRRRRKSRRVKTRRGKTRRGKSRGIMALFNL